MLKWIKYSGASIVFTANPLHWQYVPNGGRAFAGEWAGPKERTWYVTWLFLTARVWIDDGSW